MKRLDRDNLVRRPGADEAEPAVGLRKGVRRVRLFILATIAAATWAGTGAVPALASIGIGLFGDLDCGYDTVTNTLRPVALVLRGSAADTGELRVSTGLRLYDSLAPTELVATLGTGVTDDAIQQNGAYAVAVGGMRAFTPEAGAVFGDGGYGGRALVVGHDYQIHVRLYDFSVGDEVVTAAYTCRAAAPVECAKKIHVTFADGGSFGHPPPVTNGCWEYNRTPGEFHGTTGPDWVVCSLATHHAPDPDGKRHTGYWVYDDTNPSTSPDVENGLLTACAQAAKKPNKPVSATKAFIYMAPPAAAGSDAFLALAKRAKIESLTAQAVYFAELYRGSGVHGMPRYHDGWDSSIGWPMVDLGGPMSPKQAADLVGRLCADAESGDYIGIYAGSNYKQNWPAKITKVLARLDSCTQL